MKIAVCISGQPRNVHKGFAHIQPNLLNGNDTDVFIHTWIDETQVNKPYIAANGVVLSDRIPENILDEIVRMYKPVKILAEPQREFDEKDYTIPPEFSVIRPFTSLSQKYSTMMAHKLRRDSDRQYDAVVRLRFDFALTERIDFQTIDTHGVTLPNKCSHPGGVDDTFAIGSPDFMDIYADLFNHIEKLYNAGIPFCDEIFLGQYLAQQKVPVHLKNIAYSLIRG